MAFVASSESQSFPPGNWSFLYSVCNGCCFHTWKKMCLVKCVLMIELCSDWMVLLQFVICFLGGTIQSGFGWEYLGYRDLVIFLGCFLNVQGIPCWFLNNAHSCLALTCQALLILLASSDQYTAGQTANHQVFNWARMLSLLSYCNTWDSSWLRALYCAKSVRKSLMALERKKILPAFFAVTWYRFPTCLANFTVLDV